MASNDVIKEKRQVTRPALGALAPAALAAWVAVLWVEDACWNRFAGKEAFAWRMLVGMMVMALVILVLTGKRKSFATLLESAAPSIASVLCVLVCGTLYWNAWAASVEATPALLADGDTLQVELTGDPAVRDYGTVSTGEALLQGKHVALRMLWPEDADALSAGHKVALSGTLKVPSDDDSGRWNHRQGFVGMVSATQVEDAGYAAGLAGWIAPFRDGAMNRIARLGGEASGLLAGILIGNKTLYSGTELEQDFKTTGLAHLMAVSGTHLAVVALLAGWVLGRLRLKRWLRSSLLVALLVAYVALTAFAPSALRACMMCAVAFGAARFGRRRHALSALSFCVVVFLALEPSLAFSVGYQLSVLCMVGLLVMSPLVSVWLEYLLPAKLEGLAEPVAATLAANMATLPATIPLFCQLPLISPIATMLASPLITGALALGIPGVLAGAVIPPLGGLMLILAGTVANICSALVHFLANLPMACAPLDASAEWLGTLFAAGAVALWAWWPTPKDEVALSRSQSPLIVLAVIAPLALVLLLELGGPAGVANLLLPGSADSDAQVIMFDVGQADAMLIRDGDAAILVDTGEESALLLKALARYGVTKLDAVVLSHKDVDHTGALSALTGVIDVRHVYVHADLLASQSEANVLNAAAWVLKGESAEGVHVGTQLKAGRFSLTLLAPENGGEGENQDSLIWLLEFDGDDDGVPESKGLLTGDAEEAELAPVVDLAGDVDFLKVGHHGSRGALNESELAILRPEYALISVGADNDYGHPTGQILSLLEECGAKILRTDEEGDIRLAFE